MLLVVQSESCFKSLPNFKSPIVFSIFLGDGKVAYVGCTFGRYHTKNWTHRYVDVVARNNGMLIILLLQPLNLGLKGLYMRKVSMLYLE